MLQESFLQILSTFIKLPFVFKTFVLSIFEWPLKTGFTALANREDAIRLLLLQQSDLGLDCLSMPFQLATSVLNFRKINVGQFGVICVFKYA